MKTIIVPLDFSKEAKAGLDLSLMLAKKSGADIKMVHVISPVDKSDEDLKKEKKEAGKKFEEILDICRKEGNINCGLTYAVEEGQIFRAIDDIAQKFEDSVTVLSTHGESGFEELFIGGNAYKIVSHAKNPVITTRRSKLSSNIDTIVMPLDITFQTREKVPYTAKLAKMFGSEIHVLTVQLSKLKSIEKKLNQYSKQVAEYLNHHEVSYKITHVHGSNLTDVTLDYAYSVDADLISIMAEQEKNPANLLLGKYAHQMINKSFIPVLSFPNYHIRVTAEDIRTLGAFIPR
ncbi:MAG TPA: universal stress protein [Bacteroidales bacterium]|nr:universal stress protein [Bacteroidales bacterium]